MPGYVNIGAYVGAGTMVDTWATVGSCAQIGKDCHLSGGVGIGGVLEPPGARPVIVEDGAFIGSRVVIVEGVVVEKEAVIGTGVVLTASTAILDVTGPEVVEHRGAQRHHHPARLTRVALVDRDDLFDIPRQIGAYGIKPIIAGFLVNRPGVQTPACPGGNLSVRGDVRPLEESLGVILSLPG